jgi:hypothetical protein
MATSKGVLTETSLLTVDSGYHSEKNLQALEARGIDALIADNDMRKRDERFATQSRHQQGSDPLHDKSRKQCLRNPHKPAGRQVTFFRGKAPGTPESATARMKRKIDSPDGRCRYGRRFATVEPVFGNIRGNKRLNRFTLRSRRKVDTQWKLYCLVHNIEKLMNYGTIESKR